MEPRGPAGPPAAPDRSALRADCARCVGLCCVAPAFSASSDFAIDKPAGTPCPHLGPDSRCGIHAELRPSGFPGCDVYDCFGAGQQVSQVTFADRHWRDDPGTARRMFAVFPVVRLLHELRWYLTEALTLDAARPLHAELRSALEETARLADGGPAALAALDVTAHGRGVDALLTRASALARTDAPRRGRDRRGADLVGADLRGVDLLGADLRGALLLGADLRDARLTLADLLGADLRGADVRGARLAGSLFLTGPQVTAARGDAGTTLPPWLDRPAHWPSSRTPPVAERRRRPRRR